MRNQLLITTFDPDGLCITTKFLVALTLKTLWPNSTDDKLVIFSYFSQKTGLETICMECLSLSSGRNKNN